MVAPNGAVPSFVKVRMAIERVEEQLRRFTGALDAAGVPYAVIGGNAVAAWITTVDAARIRHTKDVDVLLRRADLERASEALAGAGLILDSVGGKPVFLEASDPLPSRGVHVLLAGEPPHPTVREPAPDVADSVRADLGFSVLDLLPLVKMKLGAFRLHDQVHLQDLMKVGVLTAAVARRLSDRELQQLRQLRDQTEFEPGFDVPRPDF